MLVEQHFVLTINMDSPMIAWIVMIMKCCRKNYDYVVIVRCIIGQYETTPNGLTTCSDTNLETIVTWIAGISGDTP